MESARRLLVIGTMPNCCPLKEQCPLLGNDQPLTTVWLLSYCDTRKKYSNCARFKLANEGQEVPSTLMPNGVTTSSNERPWNERLKDGWRNALKSRRGA